MLLHNVGKNQQSGEISHRKGMSVEFTNRSHRTRFYKVSSKHSHDALALACVGRVGDRVTASRGAPPAHARALRHCALRCAAVVLVRFALAECANATR